MNSALYLGTVMHARHSPRDHVFRYPVYQWLIDLDEQPELDRRFRAFGWNRRAATTWHDADHIDIRGHLSENGVDLGDGARIVCLTNLRVLGYVLNPVSFWWCYRAGGELACIVAEINNTFANGCRTCSRRQTRWQTRAGTRTRPTSGSTCRSSCRWISATRGLATTSASSASGGSISHSAKRRSGCGRCETSS